MLPEYEAALGNLRGPEWSEPSALLSRYHLHPQNESLEFVPDCTPLPQMLYHPVWRKRDRKMVVRVNHRRTKVNEKEFDRLQIIPVFSDMTQATAKAL